jgi:hypothetical protein
MDLLNLTAVYSTVNTAYSARFSGWPASPEMQRPLLKWTALSKFQHRCVPSVFLLLMILASYSNVSSVYIP